MHKITKLLAFAVTLLSLTALPLLAQVGDNGQTILKGIVLDSATQKAISGVQVTLVGNNQQTTSEADGSFIFYNLRAGSDHLVLTSALYATLECEIKIKGNQTNDAGPLLLKQTTMRDNAHFAGIVDNIDLDQIDDEGAGQSANTMVIFSNDIYLQNGGYQFSQFRHRNRGYDNTYEERYINGISFNEGVRGVFNYSSIGALNDMTRNGNRINYMGASPFSFGDLGGSENINMRPANYTRGGKATISGTNRNYFLRGILSYNTGLMDNGWALSVALGGRYSHEGAIEGVFYKNISYMLGAEKVWDAGKQRISVITFGSPVERGQQGSSVNEAVRLVCNNTYNPNWGWQNGKKRNARVVKSWDPTLIISHTWKPSYTTTLTTGIAGHYNRYGRSALNWYNGADPRPDYYRYLPSYFEGNPDVQSFYAYQWRKGIISQIDWDHLYEVNHLNNLYGDGSAVYMVEERRSDLGEFAFNSTLNTYLSREVALSAGVDFKYSYSKQFKTVDDLLGASYLQDNDKYAERDFAGNNQVVQNDLNKPGRRVWKGDVFGYDYRYHIYRAGLWAQNEHKYANIDLYYGAKITFNSIQREGMMKNGRYPDNSFGKGDLHTFINFEGKFGITYKIDGRHFLTMNASYLTRPQLERAMYVSPDITDQTVPNLKSKQAANIDLNYIFSTPKVKGRLSAFYTGFWDDMQKVAYYDDIQRTFVLHTLYGVNKVHRGLELGIEYKPTDALTLRLIGTTAQYYYNNNPTGVMNSTNGQIQNKEEVVYMKNLYLGGIPQMLGTFGVGYFYKYWFFDINLNAFGYNHIDPAPIRRLASNYTNVTPPGVPGHDPKQYEAFLQYTTQERFDPGMTVDLSIGKILYLKNRDRINFNFSISNLLNKQDIRTGGFEQGRINLDHPERFTNKHYYMQGINFFLNASYNW